MPWRRLVIQLGARDVIDGDVYELTRTRTEVMMLDGIVLLPASLRAQGGFMVVKVVAVILAAIFGQGCQ